MIRTLYELRRDTNIIDDDTRVIISAENPYSGKQTILAKGNWFNDDVLEYIQADLLELRIYPMENRLCCEVDWYIAEEHDYSNVVKEATNV